ncbi:flavin reductase family protein [Microbacterium luticocti]|uniref:flavin reductase family protein n=1 Tax=Microbacterium luticocti TaxID=451764 RepID=UPI0004295403|nr:flavin reductase family protein [Microbacterium luticocti]
MDDASIGRVLASTPTLGDQEAYKQVSSLAAKGVAAVTAHDGRWDHAVTVTDHLSVSYDPPTMLVSVYELSRVADAIVASGRFGVSLLTDRQRRIADWLGEPGAPLVGLLDQVPHLRRDPHGPALIEGALAWFDLRVHAVHRAATHLLVVGQVTAMSERMPWDARPLVRWRGRYQS